MLTIDIAALNLGELRQLLAVATAREQHALVEQLTAELAARRTGAARQPLGQVRTPSPPFETSPPPRRRMAVALVAATAGVMAGALGWGVSLPSSAPPPTAVKVAMPRAAVAIATPPSAPAMLQAAGTDPMSIGAVTARPRSGARPLHNPCYELPTPADRLVCGYPSLADRERRLRSALAAAAAAGAEPEALAADQAAWKADRDGVSDRLALADLYDRRIRDLTETGP